MKADIITLHTVDNYGSVLQTYATQEIFRQLGFETEIIDYWRKNNLPEYRVEQIMKENALIQKSKTLWSKSQILTTALKRLIYFRLAHNVSPMAKFINEKVDLTNVKYTSFQQLKRNPPLADVYVTGSDQVWNSTWNGGIDKAYYLDFVPRKDAIKIAFAASIGKTTIDNDEKKVIKPLLKQYRAISVREDSAVQLLKTMDVNARLILDPTLMLTGKEWEKLDKRSPIVNEPYLLVYQLNDNEKMEKYAVEVCRKMKWKLVRFGFARTDKSKRGYCVMKPSIEEFINLISNAACVITDSFHATAFSLNLGTNLISVDPPRFNTRIRSILKLTQTEDRIVRDYDDFSILKSKVDNKNVQKILNTERDKGFKWLRNVLKLDKETR